MSRDEVKTAINELLNNTPENILKEILEYQKSFEGKSGDAITLSKNLRTILSEDKELLQSLAQ